MDDEHWCSFTARRETLEALHDRFRTLLVGGRPLGAWARRPEVTVTDVASHLDREFAAALIERAMTDVRYEGYLVRQQAQIRRQADGERSQIPAWLDYAAVSGLRAEAAEVLAKFRPATMGQAGRLAGVNPADLALLAVAIRRGPHPRAELA